MRVHPVSYARPGRLVPKRPRGLRARSVVLRPGGTMDWHSTEEREELLIALDGAVRVEVARASIPLRAGRSLWLPKRTMHRVLNRSRARARYIYVTGS